MLHGLRTGLGVAILAIFLMLAANFQSLRLSLAVMSVLPAAIAGVALALWITGTTLNIQSFMGAIMAVGGGGGEPAFPLSFFGKFPLFRAPSPQTPAGRAPRPLRPAFLSQRSAISPLILAARL